LDRDGRASPVNGNRQFPFDRDGVYRLSSELQSYPT
jgi:hypothetical protein